ncbi:MAG: tRNA (adenine-N1)-methyltransferase [Actinomycetes bacterium]
MTFRVGDPALLIDDKGRQYLLRLEPGREFVFHKGAIPHEKLIGAEDGSWVETHQGARLLLLSPRLSDYVLRMKRGAQVVYPKDLGPILVYADIGPGMTVLEAGTGSGALTLGLARAVGTTGRVVSVERREDHHEFAVKTITRWFGEIPPHVELRVGAVEDSVAGVKPERIVLDVPEPWHVVRAAAEHQPTGGVLCAYLPTVPQVETTVETARETGRFAEIEVKEFLVREWNVSGRSVRPEHTMVGHTGFLVFMRRIQPAE